MSTIIAAPYPGTTVTMVLPNAKLEDMRASQQKIAVRRSMLGRLITYVKSNSRQTHRLSFELSRMKALELEAFVTIYYRAEWLITLYDGSQWIVQLLANPFEQITTDRAGGWPGNEFVTVTLQLSATPY